jgi:ribosomal protein L32
MPLRLPPGVRPVADPPIEQMPGLELTSYEPVAAVRSAVIADLEVTVAPPAGAVLPDYIPGFETTATEELLELPGGVADPTLPGIERTVEEFERSPMPLTEGPEPCPFCGFVQASGRVCNNCGRSRFRVLRSGLSRAELDEAVRCPSCGAKVKRSKVCSDCGNPMPPLE